MNRYLSSFVLLLAFSFILVSHSSLLAELDNTDQQRLEEIEEEIDSLKHWQAKHRQSAKHFNSKANRIQFRSSREAGKFRQMATDAKDNATALQFHIDQLLSEKKMILSKSDS